MLEQNIKGVNSTVAAYHIFLEFRRQPVSTGCELFKFLQEEDTLFPLALYDIQISTSLKKQSRYKELTCL